MRLIRYKLSNVDTGFRKSEGIDRWQFDEVFFDRVNLLVGDSATGKTRFINTIYNFTQQIVSDKIMLDGDWDTDFEIDGRIYNYKLVAKNSKVNVDAKEIYKEELIRKDDNLVLVKRDQDKFNWKGKELPKLSNYTSSVSLLKNEELMSEIYDNLRRVIARRFFRGELEESFRFMEVSPELQKQIIDNKDLKSLLYGPINFHNKMKIIETIDRTTYRKITDLFKTAFPFVIDTSIKTLPEIFQSIHAPIQAPVFCIKEKGIQNWIPVNDISSGMQKIFLLILDLFLMQDNGIMLIDEYENSLGISAINFLPELIYSISEKCQFIITSHHPYIIKNIPIDNWYIFHRNGLTVRIKNGKELKEKYKESKQDHFIQLINDPLYTGGVE